MDIFEKQMKMLKENEQIFNQYYEKEDVGIFISDDKKQDFSKKGSELLEETVIASFEQVRCIYYWNIINRTLREFSFWEWAICLEEKVLLEYAIPIFSRVLKSYPMLCGEIASGRFSQWGILYEIAKVDGLFWMQHAEWKNFFEDIIKDALEKNEKETINSVSDIYIMQFHHFSEI